MAHHTQLLQYPVIRAYLPSAFGSASSREVLYTSVSRAGTEVWGIPVPVCHTHLLAQTCTEKDTAPPTLLTTLFSQELSDPSALNSEPFSAK